MPFNLGDRVQFNNPASSAVLNGACGYIEAIRAGDCYDVLFDTYGSVGPLDGGYLTLLVQTAPAQPAGNANMGISYIPPMSGPNPYAVPRTAHQFNAKFPNGALVTHNGVPVATKRYAYTLGSGRSVVKLQNGVVVPLDTIEHAEAL